MDDVFISRRQYGELDKLNEDGTTCQIWQVSGTGLTNSGQTGTGMVVSQLKQPYLQAFHEERV
jgi:hypothetical protein